MMKASIIKRMLTGALIASLVMAPAMSVAAASSDAPEGSTVVEQVVESTTTISCRSSCKEHSCRCGNYNKGRLPCNKR